MDEIIPLSSGRIREQIAGVTALPPVASDLVTVESCREFLACENRTLNQVRGLIPLQLSKCGTNTLDKQQAPGDTVVDRILVYACVRPEGIRQSLSSIR